MADDGAGKTGGKGPLGELVKAESMIQLAIALPAGCVIGWLVGSWLDKHFHQAGSRLWGFCWGRWRGLSRSSGRRRGI